METIIYAANTSFVHERRNSAAELEKEAPVETPQERSTDSVEVIPEPPASQPKATWKSKRERKNKAVYGLKELTESGDAHSQQ